MGRLGAASGALVFGTLAWSLDVGIPAIVAVVAANLASFVAWGYLSRAWRGRRTYVLLEHALAAWAATVATNATVDVEAGSVTDAWSAGMAVTLAFGRIGCLFTGCCHGRASDRGVAYPWLRPWSAGSPWSELRVVPLQLAEMAGLALLAILGGTLAVTAPGWSASVVPAAYAVLRYHLELRRGDSRPYLGRWSQGQLLSALVLALVTVLGRSLVGAIGLCLIAFTTLLRGRRFGPPVVNLGSAAELAALQVLVASPGPRLAWKGMALDRSVDGRLRPVGRDAQRATDLVLILALLERPARASAEAGAAAERAVRDRL